MTSRRKNGLCCAITSANKLKREFPFRPSPALKSLNIAHRKRGVPLPRSVQSQRCLSPHSAQGVRSKGRRASTTEAGAPPRDYEGEPDDMIAFLPSPRALDRCGDKYLRQCLLFFPFSSLNAHCRMVGCSFFLAVPVPGIGDPRIV